MKELAIAALCSELLKDSIERMNESIIKAINSGAIDIESWDPVNNRYMLPKTIIMAVLENEVYRHSPIGTSFDKQMNKEVKNIKLFL